MALTNIPNGDVDADSPITVALMTALRDNGVFGSMTKATFLTSSGSHDLDSFTRTSVALLVAGGGGGASASGPAPQGLGGKAGAMEWSVTARSGGETLTVVIGAGGAAFAAGGNTTLTGHTTAVGGQPGVTNDSTGPGQAGDSCLGAGGANKASAGNGNSAAANSGAGGGGAQGSGTGGSGGSGAILILEFAE